MQYVFSTTAPKRYEFPTHINDLVMDRNQASWSEVFLVVIHPDSAPPLHKHDDTEQVFFIIEGAGTLTIGSGGEAYPQDRKRFPVKPGDVVRIPISTWHSIRAESNTDLKYLCVDCFGQRPQDEPTWDDHVKVLCGEQGWDYESVIAERDRITSNK